MIQKLKAPFPYFGGKSKVADIIWERFGNVKNYVEPFFGSGAVLLRRPHWKPGCNLIETVNDADGLLANFWRALAADPEGVGKHADWPVNETELRARHTWLVTQKESLTERLLVDHEWYDVKVAGFWVWEISANAIARDLFTDKASIVARGHQGNGIITWSKNASAYYDRLNVLSTRIRPVRVRCGDWARCVQSPSMMGNPGLLTGIFLDPPYGEGDIDYSGGGNTSNSIAQEVWRWAVENGENSKLRICVAGYDDGRKVPDGWQVVEWKAHGGYGNQNKTGNTNCERERLWFSPHCIDPNEDSVLSLFGQREGS